MEPTTGPRKGPKGPSKEPKGPTEGPQEPTAHPGGRTPPARAPEGARPAGGSWQVVREAWRLVGDQHDEAVRVRQRLEEGGLHSIA